jgi:soluble lytic murein transglycosylase-like protein
MISRTTWTGDIASAAAAARVPPDLIEAIVIVESSGNPNAINAEPRYPYLWDVAAWKPFRELSRDELASKLPPPDFRSIAGDRDQEWWAQQMSWGLMQIMGALARELGFRGPYLSELCRVDVNLRLGCLYVGNLLGWSNGDERKAVGAYNAGRGGAVSAAGRAYSDKVFGIRAQLAPTKPTKERQ